jgi:hypothetical protein
MPEFLIETYIPRDALSIATLRADDAPAGCRAGLPPGVPVRFLGAMVVPEENVCFYLYRAPSVSAVRAAMTLAGLRATGSPRPLRSGRHGPPGPHTWHRSTVTIPPARTACPEQSGSSGVLPCSGRAWANAQGACPGQFGSESPGVSPPPARLPWQRRRQGEQRLAG